MDERVMEPVMEVTVSKRRWKWIGHTCHKDDNNIARQTVDCNSQVNEALVDPKLSGGEPSLQKTEPKENARKKFALLLKFDSDGDLFIRPLNG